jgi:hypothetical protein
LKSLSSFCNTVTSSSAKRRNSPHSAQYSTE